VTSHCPRCHTPQRPGARFCRTCGAPLVTAAARAVESPADPTIGAFNPRERAIPIPWQEVESPPRAGGRVPAPLMVRLVAFFLDLVLLLGAMGVTVVGAVALRGRLLLAELAMWSALAACLVLLVNHLILCSVRGQSVGMALVGIQIVRADGQPLSWGRSLLRHTLGYGLAALPLGLGFLWMLVDGQGRGWHDLLSGTRVVTEADDGEAQGVFAGSSADRR